MTLGDLSRRMMVTNGNVTGLVERLVQSGHLERSALAERPPGADRQADAERPGDYFSRMASAHEAWIADLFGAAVAQGHHDLIRSLGKLKDSVKSTNGDRA